MQPAEGSFLSYGSVLDGSNVLLGDIEQRKVSGHVELLASDERQINGMRGDAQGNRRLVKRLAHEVLQVFVFPALGVDGVPKAGLPAAASRSAMLLTWSIMDWVMTRLPPCPAASASNPGSQFSSVG
jgi:hypothetical protein